MSPSALQNAGVLFTECGNTGFTQRQWECMMEVYKGAMFLAVMGRVGGVSG